jgi:predicted DNA binding CopG/RHH family protein
VSAVAEQAGVPYQRFIRMALERALQTPQPKDRADQK